MMNKIDVGVNNVGFRAKPIGIGKNKAVQNAVTHVVNKAVIPPQTLQAMAGVGIAGAAAATGLGVAALQKGNEVEQTTTDNNASKVEEPKQESLVPLNKVHTIRDFKTTDPSAEALKNELLTYEENWQKEAGMTLYPNGMVENVTKDYFKERYRDAGEIKGDSILYNVDFAENGYLKNSSYLNKNLFKEKQSLSINTDKDGRIVSEHRISNIGDCTFDVENKYTYNNDGTITSEFINNGNLGDYSEAMMYKKIMMEYPFKAGVNTIKVIDIDGKKFIKIKSEGNNGEINYYVQPLESYSKDCFTGVAGNKKMLTDIPNINYVETVESEEKLQTTFLEPAKQEIILTIIKDKSTGKMEYSYYDTQSDYVSKRVIIDNDGNSSHYIYNAKTGHTKVLYKMQEDKLTAVSMYDNDGENTKNVYLTEDGKIKKTVDYETYEDGSYKASVKPANGEPYVKYFDKDGNGIEPKE